MKNAIDDHFYCFCILQYDASILLKWNQTFTRGQSSRRLHHLNAAKFKIKVLHPYSNVAIVNLKLKSCFLVLKPQII